MAKCNILAVEPTVFFEQRQDGLHQLVKATLECAEGSAEASLEVVIEGETILLPLAKLPAGESSHEIFVPDARSEGEARFRLLLGDRSAAEKTVSWKPQRHWEVYLVQYSHHDFGYTDLPSNVLQEFDTFMDQVLQFCEQTEDWTDRDAVFRYLCEQFWSVDHYMQGLPQHKLEQLVHYLRNGQIEITALFGNQTLELCGHEELVRLLYPAFALKAKYGVEIVSAEHNDIPGFPWGLASVLAGAGVKYFSPGVPQWYFGRGEDRVHFCWDPEKALPLDQPTACWWEGPDGSRVLLWLDLHGGGEWQPYDYEQAVVDLADRLRTLEQDDYPFDMVSYTLRGGQRDNAPPTERYAYLAREWNRRWAYPRLVNATNSLFLKEFEHRWGGNLKTLRGDLPGTDYGVGAMCTPRETAANRNAHDWLNSAEKLAALASLLCREYPYPQEILDKAYKDTFFYDLHAWGPMDPGGAAQDAGWCEKSAYAYRARAQAHDVMIKAGKMLADQISLPGEAEGAAAGQSEGESGADYYLTVFNSLGHERTDVVRAWAKEWGPCGTPMFWAYPPGEKPVYIRGKGLGSELVFPPLELLAQPFELIDADTGNSVPYQIEELRDPKAAKPWAPEHFGMGKVDPRHLKEIVFTAEKLPALGYKTYLLKSVGRAPAFGSQSSVNDGEKGGSLTVENDFYRLRVDKSRGVIAELFDKQLNRELVDAQAEHGFGRLIIRHSETGEREEVDIDRVALHEDGPVCTTVRLEGHGSCCPRVVVELVVYHALKRIDLNARILKDSTPLVELYLAFPFSIETPDFRFEASGSVMRPIEDQWPGSNTDYYAVQHWVDVFNEECGVVWSPLDSPLAELGGLWPGYVSSAHHAVTGPEYGHPFLRPDELKKGHLYSMVSYNNFRTNFSNVQPGEMLVRYVFGSHAGDWRRSRAWQFGWNAANPPLSLWVKGPQVGSLPTSSSFCCIEADNVILINWKRAEDGNGTIIRLFETAGEETDTAVTLPALPSFHAVETNLVEENQRTLPVYNGSVRIAIPPLSIMTIRVTPDL